MKILCPTSEARRYLVSALFLTLSLLASGQAVGDYRTNATGTWNWTTAANWQRCVTAGTWTGATNTTYPGQNTGAGTVNILDNTTVRINANVPNSIGALRIDGGGNDSYVQFMGSYTLTVTGQTYLNSNSNNDEKAVYVDAGIFSTASISANSTGDTQDAYIRISTGSATVSGDIALNSTNLRTYIIFTGAGSLYVGGTVSGGNITSTANGGSAAPTSGTVIYNGSSSQAIGPYTYYNMTVNNSAGVTLPANTTINNTLTMTRGNITNNGYTLIVTGSLSYTDGTVIGTMRRNLTATGTEYLYPLGTASTYNPLKITFTNLTSGTLTATYVTSDIGSTGLPLSDAGNYIYDRQTTGYWTMTAGTLASTNYSVKLTYTGFSDVDSRARILKRTNGGSLALNGTHGTVSSPEISRTGLSGISTTTTDFAIGKPHPRFTTNPSDFTGCTASFTIAVSGSTPLTYRWQENSGSGFVNMSDGGMFTGTGTTTLSITGATGSMNGNQYRCVVTDALGYSSTSNAATLTVNLPDVSLGYAYTMDVTLDPASGSSDLTDFPALISFTSSLLATTANGGHTSNSNGYDIIFTDQNGNKLDHQIESYTATTGQFTGWVRIPLLSHTATTTIRMLYGNANISTDPSVTTVWTSSYKGIWHLNGTGYTNDATSNLNNGTNNATTSITGKIAGGRGFNGTTAYIMTPANGFVPNNNNQTISIWANYSVAPSGNRNLISFQNASQSSAIQVGFRGGHAVAWKWGGTLLADGGVSPSINAWHYYVYVFDGTTSYIYIDGVISGSSTEAPQTYLPSEGDIGRYNDGEYLAASLDEPRFSMSPKSAGWIMTEYMNQNDPASFIALGSETANTILGTVGVCSSSYTLNTGSPAGGTYSGTGVSGTNFSASLAGTGTHSITYAYTSPLGCTNSAVKDIIVTPVPSAPVAPDRQCCVTNIADLEATGNNLRWYSDAGLSVQVGTGTPFATGRTTAGTYIYYVTQTVNGCQSSATQVRLTVFSSLSITTQPGSATICSGNNATFTVVAAGYNVSYQWQENGVNLSDTGPYSGVNTATLLITNPASGLNGRSYRCIVSSSCGTSPLTSTAGTLTILSNNLWTGTVSTDWNNNSNWSCGFVPTPGVQVYIPNVTNKPVLNTGSVASVNNITIESGSSLTISGNTIRIAGSVTNSGTFNVTAGTVEFNGTSAQQIAASLFYNNSVFNLVINNTSGVSLLGPLSVTGSVLATSGDLTTGGFLTLASDASRTAYVDGTGSGRVLGDVVMQRYLSSGYGYKYISSPFASSTVNNLSDEVNLSAGFPLIYKYVESRTASGWVSYVRPDSLLHPLQGYSVNFGSSASPVTLDIGGIINNGPLAVTLFNHNYTYTKGLNLVGNPYPSAIDWDAPSGWSNTNIDDAIYLFRASTTDQYGGTYSSYVNGISSDGMTSSIIPSMQGFFVHVSNGTYPVTGVLSMNNSVRVNDYSHGYAKSGETKTDESLLRLSVAFSNDTAKKDYMLIYTDEKATGDFDAGFDALKLLNTDLKIPNIYSVLADDQKLSINGLPPHDGSPLRIPLGVKANTAGTLIFSVRSMAGSFLGNNISLYDATDGVVQSLDNGSEYNVYLPVAEYKNRFFLDVNYITTGTEEPVTSDRKFFAWVTGGTLRMNIYSLNDNDGVIYLTNLTGQKLFSEEVKSTGYHEFGVPVREGVYLITLVSGTSRTVQKFIVSR